MSNERFYDTEATRKRLAYRLDRAERMHNAYAAINLAVKRRDGARSRVERLLARPRLVFAGPSSPGSVSLTLEDMSGLEAALGNNWMMLVSEYLAATEEAVRVAAVECAKLEAEVEPTFEEPAPVAQRYAKVIEPVDALTINLHRL